MYLEKHELLMGMVMVFATISSCEIGSSPSLFYVWSVSARLCLYKLCIM